MALSPFQEEGLQKYQRVEAEIRLLERQMAEKEEKGLSNNKYVPDHNNKVDQLERIVKHYGL